MQKKLFTREGRSPRPKDLAQLKDRLKGYRVLKPFKIFLIGSLLNPSRKPKDIDLLLVRRDFSRLTLRNVENALMLIRQDGINARIRIDACFRNTHADTLAGRLHPMQKMRTWKLEDPMLTYSLRIGILDRYRRVGRYLIVTQKQAYASSYYNKLPQGPRGTRILLPGELIH
jgi:hypothetical protein